MRSRTNDRRLRSRGDTNATRLGREDPSAPDLLGRLDPTRDRPRLGRGGSNLRGGGPKPPPYPAGSPALAPELGVALGTELTLAGLASAAADLAVEVSPVLVGRVLPAFLARLTNGHIAPWLHVPIVEGQRSLASILALLRGRPGA